MSLSDQRRAEILEAATAFYQGELSRHERILAYLRGRKLSDGMIPEARLGYANGGLRDHLLRLGFSLVECQESGLVRADGKDYFFRKIVIPYLSKGQVVLMRGRTDPDEKDKAYFPLPGYEVRLYNEDALDAGTEQIVIVEGEFDALLVKGWQFPVVGQPGTGVFKAEWLSRFGSFKEVYVCLDMDEPGQRAAWNVAILLGDKARIVHLPAGKDITEFAQAGHTVQEFARLLSQAKGTLSLAVERLSALTVLEDRAREAREVLRQLIAKGSLMIGVFRDPICQAMRWPKDHFDRMVREVEQEDRRAKAEAAVSSGAPPPKAMELLDKAGQTKELHPAMDFVENVFWYGVPLETGCLFVNSRRQLLKAGELPDHLRLAEVGYGLRRIPSGAIKRFLQGEAMPGHLLADRLGLFLRRFVFFKDQRTYNLVAVWVMGTYVHVLFRYYGYLHIRSPEKRCGKSLLEEILSKLAFNATVPLTHPTTAQLYRGPSRDRGTQILDEIDRLKTDKELFGALLAVLNVGFQRGGTVLRYERVGERFEERSFEPFAPRILAGIATTSLPDVLEDRSIPVSMHRRRRTERVERFNVRVLETEILRLREELYLWALSHAEELVQVYEQMGEVPALADLDDRLRDIWEPLVAIASLSDAECNDGSTHLVDLMTAVAGDLCQFRLAAEQETPTVILIQSLLEIRRELGEYHTPTRLLEELRKRPGFDWLTSTRKLSGLLNPLGFVAKSHRFPDQPSTAQRAYRLDQESLEELLSRYAAASSEPPIGAETAYETDLVAGQPDKA